MKETVDLPDALGKFGEVRKRGDPASKMDFVAEVRMVVVVVDMGK